MALNFQQRVEAITQNSAALSATASGTNTYTATLTPAITAYASTQVFFIKFTNANTAASTINLNGLGAKSLVKNGATALESGDIAAGQIYAIAYDGTNFQLVGKLIPGGSGTRLVWDSVITPTSLAADTDNWNPSGLATTRIIRATATGGDRTLTGLTAPSPAIQQVIVLYNIGTGGNTIKLTNNDAASTAGNRFLTNSGAVIDILDGGAVILTYDVTSLRWRVASHSL